MPSIRILTADNDEKIEAARALCREWLDWHWRHYPENWPREGNPLDPDTFEKVIRDLPSIHARPKGAILLAYLDDAPVGCVMYDALAPGIAQFNRMFVSESGRGHGLGRRLLDTMFEAMVADGYEKVVFSSAKFLTHARDMYVKAGFKNIPHPEGFPDAWRDYVYFMERSL